MRQTHLHKHTPQSPRAEHGHALVVIQLRLWIHVFMGYQSSLSAEERFSPKNIGLMVLNNQLHRNVSNAFLPVAQINDIVKAGKLFI
jgi:hypothetical protein